MALSSDIVTKDAIVAEARPAGWRRWFVRELGALPPRVQAIVDGEIKAAEILAGWLVLGIVLFLGLLYLVSPKALDGMGELKPVPVAVAIGLALAVLRLGLAYAGLMRGFAVVLFTIADFALLYGLIWSFHWQYGQPASFSLKAPTFLFTFMLIAIRALRFEPWNIITAGLTAAAGWLLVTAHAFTRPDVGVTRDFVTYLTSNSLLVGAEVEKVVAILLVTGVLTLAIVRGRRQLVTAAVGSTATEDLSRFFDPDVAERITSAEKLEPGRGENRECAILVADIRGFTRFVASLPPHDVLRLLIDYQRRMGAVITEHGGAIDKFLGDGILATFGCARPSPTESADALRALDALLDEADRFKADLIRAGRQPIDLGFSVVAGRVLFGTVGDKDRLEFTVIGEAANLAAKLEKHNKALKARAITDRATFDRAAAQGFDGAQRFRQRDGERVEGVAAPIDLLYRPFDDGPDIGPEGGSRA